MIDVHTLRIEGTEYQRPDVIIPEGSWRDVWVGRRARLCHDGISGHSTLDAEAE